MNKTRRVVFTFTKESFNALVLIKNMGEYGSLAEALSDSLRIHRALQKQDAQGFSEVVVRNPETHKERTMDWRAGWR